MCFLPLDLKEASPPPSTQTTCLRRSSREEGQEQPRGPGWAGLGTWGSPTSKTGVGPMCQCLDPGCSSRAWGPKEEGSAKMKHLFCCLSKTRQIQAGSCPERGSLQGSGGLRAGILLLSSRLRAVCEPSCGNDRYSCPFPAALPGIKGESKTFQSHSRAVATLGSRGGSFQ